MPKKKIRKILLHFTFGVENGDSPKHPKRETKLWNDALLDTSPINDRISVVVKVVVE